MRQHGIFNSKADYWLHLHPLECRAYWYRVSHCLQFIKRQNIPITVGHSGNGAATGAGYLISKSAFFVRSEIIPEIYFSHIPDWMALSDRQNGVAGEEVAEVLIEHRIVHFPNAMAKPVTTKAEQFDGIDFAFQWLQPFSIEVKTERIKSDNLFVQSHEGGHRVHIVRKDGSEQFTDLRELNDEVPF